VQRLDRAADHHRRSLERLDRRIGSLFRAHAWPALHRGDAARHGPPHSRPIRRDSSTGTNLWACAQLVADMAARGEEGSIVSLLCDSGERYRSTYFNDAWLAKQGFDVAPHEAAMERFFDTGERPG
jgi:hypothetical protein